MKVWQVLLIILVIVIGALVALYFMGKRAQKKQDERQQQIDAAKQTTSMLIIDKKRLPIKQSGLPQMVIDQTPKLMRRTKLPIVKAKIGPRIVVLVADEKIFDLIPVKKEVKATISGIYITEVRGVRGPLETPAKKVGFFKRMTNKITGKK
jgi:type II secretory pathway pseudopilin PulG